MDWEWLADRLGEVGINRLGYKMRICEYISDIDLWVEFSDRYKVHTNWQRFKMGLVRNPNNRSICRKGYMGVGKYNSKDHRAFQQWQNMLRRCYDKKTQAKHPTYKGCKVSSEFLCFQNFADWFYKNYWEFGDGMGMNQMEIDKDLLQYGKKEKTYSSDTCLLLPKFLNVMIESGKFGCADKEERIHKAANEYQDKLPIRIYTVMKNFKYENND